MSIEKPSTVLAKKQYGQNFLTDASVPKRIAAESGIHDDSGVLEIGPGLGILTEQLAAVARKVVAVEIDKDLIPKLEDRFRDRPNVTIIEQDILKTDIPDLLKTHFSGMDVYVVANLPYYITTPILWKLIEGKYGFKSVTVMVQKEVADRLTSKPGTPAYGAMTATLSFYAAVRKLFAVSAGHFTPRPKVDSAVVSIVPYEEPPVDVRDEAFLLEVIRAAFGMRRKTLVNCLAAHFGWEKERTRDVVLQCGFPETVRGEALSLNDYAVLSESLIDF